MLKLKKDFIETDDLTVYTISLDDGQELVINEYEFETLKKEVNKI